MTESTSGLAGVSKHRIEALTDGIYAVAMTLLVIELKLPAHELIHSQEEPVVAVINLLPKFIAWVISFLVLSLFWLGHHRLFNQVRHVDDKLLALNLVQLGLASLMPFSSALAGEFGKTLFSQVFYSLNMTALSVMAILIARYIFRHPELCVHPVPEHVYHGARFRIGGLIAMLIPSAGNMAFMLMMVIMPISRRIEARGAIQSRETVTLSV